MKWTQFTVFLKKDVYFSNWNDSFFEFKFLAFFYIFSILYLISLKKYATHFVRQRRSPEILNKNICPAFCHINNDLVIWKTRAKMKGRKRNKGRKLWKKYRVNKKHSFLLFIHSFIYVLFFELLSGYPMTAMFTAFIRLSTRRSLGALWQGWVTKTHWAAQ